MTGTKLNRVIAAAMALAYALIPFLVLVGVLNWNEDTVKAASGIIPLVGTFVGYLFAQSTATNTDG